MPTCLDILKKSSGSLYRQNLANLSFTARHYISQPIRATSIAKQLGPSRTYATVFGEAPSTHAEAYALREKPTKSNKKDDGDETAITDDSKLDWAVRKELEYLKDPVDVAYHVKAVLKKGRFEHAARLTRLSTRDMNVVVSWNHLIDYQLQKDRIHNALKLYNEMKKRGLKPNARTYTIIFRGCAQSKHSQLAVSEAVALYHNILASDRIRPNTIHMNAVLSVCAQANDLDSMFSILQTCDDKERSPDSGTYTTILKAMRQRAAPRTTTHKLFVGGVQVDLEQEKANAVRRAKMLWEDVVTRWKDGSLVVDESLVCAMGRVLLLEGYAGANAVPKLVEQTMRIPTFASTKLREAKQQAKALALTPVESGSPVYVTPGNNTLSLVLEALRVTGKTSAATLYWRHITEQHRVEPDENNWTQLLQTLHKGKNSGLAAAYFQRIPSHLMSPKQMRTAMDICLRDNLNAKAVHHAEEIFMHMKKNTRGIPDVRASREYLRVAWAIKKSYDQKMKAPRGKNTRNPYHDWARKMTNVLEHLWQLRVPLMRKCEEDIAKGAGRPDVLGEALNFKAEVVALFRKMVAAYDYVVNMEWGIPKDVLAREARNRNELNRYVVAHFDALKHLPAGQRGEIDDKYETAGPPAPQPQDPPNHSPIPADSRRRADWTESAGEGHYSSRSRSSF